jgi:DNA-binding XRE family transcriptional regulator
MKFVDFRTNVLALTQVQMSEILAVSMSTIYNLDSGKTVSKLTRGKILRSLSEYLGREVLANEIDELAKS